MSNIHTLINSQIIIIMSHMHTNEPYPLTVVQQQLLIMCYIFMAIVTITDNIFIYTDTGMCIGEKNAYR